jgi:hypothetical protein
MFEGIRKLGAKVTDRNVLNFFHVRIYHIFVFNYSAGVLIYKEIN